MGLGPACLCSITIPNSSRVWWHSAWGSCSAMCWPTVDLIVSPCHVACACVVSIRQARPIATVGIDVRVPAGRRQNLLISPPTRTPLRVDLARADVAEVRMWHTPADGGPHSDPPPCGMRLCGFHAPSTSDCNGWCRCAGASRAQNLLISPPTRTALRVDLARADVVEVRMWHTPADGGPHKIGRAHV